MDHNTSISYVCQRCLQPLSVDKSFNQVGEHSKAELSLPLLASPEIDLDLQMSSSDHFVPAFNLMDSAHLFNGFTMLEDGDNSIVKYQTKVAAELFDVISGNTEFNHPLCEECTDTLLDVMDTHLRMIEQECYHYKMYLEKFNEEGNFDLQPLTEKLSNLKIEEERLMEEYKALKEEEKQIDSDYAEAQNERDRLERDEDKFWKEYNKYSRDLVVLEDDNRSLEHQLNYAHMHLNRLIKANVFDTTFHIWYRGLFVTINGFRLGRLTSAPVDWSEINAAWGQTALLLVALARKSNITFEKYRLVPFGSHSYIEVLADHKELPLYGSGGFRFLLNPKFDTAMVAFLDCFQQFKEELDRRKVMFNLPYEMGKGKIKYPKSTKTYSITIQFNSEEQWTKAMRMMLTNLKWMMAWVTSESCNEG